MKPTLNILIGVPGSGKSTVVNKIEQSWQHKKFIIICPDQIREDFCNGDRADQSKNGKVWSEAYACVKECMEEQVDIIFDSTMVNPSKRSKLIKMGQDAGYYIVAHVVEVSLELAKKQNAGRKWEVPEFVIDNMFKAFQFPSVDEGFDYIISYANKNEIK